MLVHRERLASISVLSAIPRFGLGRSGGLAARIALKQLLAHVRSAELRDRLSKKEHEANALTVSNIDTHSLSLSHTQKKKEQRVSN